jgi:hypothetical protein
MQENNLGARLGARTPGAGANSASGNRKLSWVDEGFIAEKSDDAQATLENVRARILSRRHLISEPAARVYSAEMSLVGAGR